MFKFRTIPKNDNDSLIYESNQKPLRIKNKKMIIILQISVLIFFGGYFTGLPISSGEDVISQNPIGMFNSELSSQNLKGDIITLNKYWKISKGSTLNINIINSASISERAIDVIKDTVMSTKTIEIDNSFLDNAPKNSVSTYHIGWKGALQNTGDSKIPIPKNFKITNSPNVYGDIIVILSNIKDRSGNTGYTKTVLEGEEIVDSVESSLINDFGVVSAQ